MALILEIVLIVCMLLWLFAALPVPASSWAAPYHPLLAWISVAIICYFMFADGIPARRAGAVSLNPSTALFSTDQVRPWIGEGDIWKNVTFSNRMGTLN
jgi:hypothetical protein